MKRKSAILVLEDGAVFYGSSFGADGEGAGEVVFNTSITGYQEILTDPSYKGQIVTMTFPLIGNYGINVEDVESLSLYAEGLIVRESCSYPSNWRHQKSLDEYLCENGVVGIDGVDTRALTRHIRDNGEQNGIISTDLSDIDMLISKAKELPGLEGQDLVKKVTTKEMYDWRYKESFMDGFGSVEKQKSFILDDLENKKFTVVVYDCGVKLNILRELSFRGCNIIVVPAFFSASEVLGFDPDGVLFSNGPGDPGAVLNMVDNAKGLLGKVPVMGICLGHQILSLALGCKTYKLRFGHHGGNHPVVDLKTGKVAITAQNHGFAVDFDSVSREVSAAFGAVNVTHLNMNDNSVEGLECDDIQMFSVQYHPESSPGPHDTSFLFDEFLKKMSA